MTALSFASKHSISDTNSASDSKSASATKSGDPSLKVVWLFCCGGLAASMSVLALGVDLTAAWL